MVNCKICKNKIIKKNNLKKEEKNNKLNLSVTTLPLSGNAYIDALSWGGTKWDWEEGSEKKLSYYFGLEGLAETCPDGITDLVGYQVSRSDWLEEEKSAMIVGLTKWTNLIGIEIEEVGSVEEADLKFYITSEDVGFYGAQYGPHSSPYEGYGIYVRYNDNSWSNSLNPGGYGFITIIHELGHAMGLAHPHDDGGGSLLFPGVTSWSEKGDNNLNQNIFTVMSYNDLNTNYNPSTIKAYGYCKGPMALDIAAIKYIYGLNKNLNNDNNIYEITDINENNTGYTCIYDTGGEDMIIYNGNKKVTIDLRTSTIKNEEGGGGYISKIDDENIYIGYTISNGTIIENATGGTNDDTFKQIESVSNILNGKNGTDTVIYKNNYEDYSINDLSENNDGSHIIVKKNNIEDILYNVEKIQFKDTLIFTNNIAYQLPFINGTTTINHNWKTINYNKVFSNPIVIVSDPTSRGMDPVTIRIKNITTTSCMIRLQEPKYKDGKHKNEKICYIIGEKGTWKLNENFRIEFGKKNSNKLSTNGFENIELTGFSNTPNILSQIQTYNGSDWVITRTKNLTNESFKITMQEVEKKNKGGHIEETIGWMALTRGIFKNDNITIESKIRNNINHNYKKITFDNNNETIPKLLTKIISYQGGDTCNTRIKNISKNSFEIKIHEEQSKDKELKHTNETIAFVSIS